MVKNINKGTLDAFKSIEFIIERKQNVLKIMSKVNKIESYMGAVLN